MKSVFALLSLTFLFHYSYSQNRFSYSNNALPEKDRVASVKIIERLGFYTDEKTGRKSGPIHIALAVDSLTGELVNVVQVERSRKEYVTTFYFNKGRLAQVTTGEKKKNLTSIDNMYSYTEEENALDDGELNLLSESSEKYDLLKTARVYLKTYKQK